MKLVYVMALGALMAFAAVACDTDPGDDLTATVEQSPVASPTATAQPEFTPTTPPSNPTATAVATVAPTAVSSATPLPELVINDASFEMGPADSPFIDLLSRVPDTDQTRSTLRMRNIAATNAIIGLELPNPPVTDESLTKHFDDINQRIEAAGLDLLTLLPFLPAWPEEMRPYLGTWHPYEYTRLSAWMAEQSIIAGSRPYQYELALSAKFSAAATDEALAACECDQPEVNEYGGMSYYSWGEEGQGTISRRLDPPIYDHIGRGPRLLVGDGHAYYSIFNDRMEGMIDATQDHVPSLADSAEYADAIRWLEGLGTVGIATMFQGGLQIEEVMTDFQAESQSEKNPDGETVIVERTEETARQSLTGTPLLLPFSMAAGGIGYDGKRPFTGFVLTHDDEATAEENLERLRAKIEDGAIDGRLVDGEYTETPLSELIARADLQQVGRIVIARIYMHAAHQHLFASFASRSWLTSSVSKYQLLLHE